MAKQDVIKAVHEKLNAGKRDLTQDTISKILDATFGAISGLEENQKCQIKDFGTFKVKRRAPRKGVALKSKKEIEIPSRLAMTFKMSSSFKEELNPAKKAKKAPAKKAPAKKAAAKKAPAKKKAKKK